jgi:hypothetical protein
MMVQLKGDWPVASTDGKGEGAWLCHLSPKIGRMPASDYSPGRHSGGPDLD